LILCGMPQGNQLVMLLRENKFLTFLSTSLNKDFCSFEQYLIKNSTT
jgi:hypothetical protein